MKAKNAKTENASTAKAKTHGGNLGTAIARACSAEGFVHAATTGVIITQNGNVTP